MGNSPEQLSNLPNNFRGCIISFNDDGIAEVIIHGHRMQLTEENFVSEGIDYEELLKHLKNEATGNSQPFNTIEILADDGVSLDDEELSKKSFWHLIFVTGLFDIQEKD